MPRPPWPFPRSTYGAAVRTRAVRPVEIPHAGVLRWQTIPPSALYHTDTHPESSRGPTRLRAVRDELAAFPAGAPAALHDALGALHTELVHHPAAPDAPIYRDMHAMFFGCVRRAMRLGDTAAAVRMLEALAYLAAHVPLCPRHRRLVLRVLAASSADDSAAAWRSVRRLMPDVSAVETTAAIRAWLAQNRVGEACRVVQWHIRRHMRHGTPPPSHALVHNVMVQMRYVATIVATAPPALQASYTEALVHLATLLREYALPLPGSREDIVWLIKLVYTYEPLLPGHAQKRAAQVIRQSLPMFMHRLCAPPAFFTPAPPWRTPRASPLLSPHAYSALVHYTLVYAKNPRWCRHVLEHMTQVRTPPLAPSDATITILLRQAARGQHPELGAYALALASHGDPIEELTAPRLLAHVDHAVAQHDAHRVLALVQFITALHLRSPKHPDGVRAASVVQRVAPALCRRTAAPHTPVDPAVGTALLSLAVKAGKTGLALRLWRWMKQTSTATPIPLPAATALMQLFADAVRKPRITRSTRPAPHAWRRMALDEYTWLLQHWRATDSALPDQRFFREVLKLLQRTAHTHDPVRTRVLADMAMLGLPAPPEYPSP